MSAEPQGYVVQTCRWCGCAFEILRPTEEELNVPTCESCKREGRGEGCESEAIYPLSRAD